MFWLACVKFLIILEADKNRRINDFCSDFCDKLFGLEMMLLPTDEHHAWLHTFSGMSCTRLRCMAWIFLLFAGKHFLWRISFSSAMTYLESSFHVWITSLKLYFVSSFLNFMQFAISLHQKFSSRPFHPGCCHQVGLLFKILSYLQVTELVLQFFARTARPWKFPR